MVIAVINPYALSALLTLLLLACMVVTLRIYQSVRRTVVQQERVHRMLLSRSNELEATLRSMVEGVLAVDLQERVISLNDAATQLLGVSRDTVTGQSIHDVIVNRPLRLFITDTVDSKEPIQSDIELADPATGEPKMYQAQGAVLHNTDRQRIGSLIVLHDVTRLRQLERVRSDFVANASHEIKTPISAIKAAAETILAANGSDPDAAERFLPVIARQADRLGAIIEDLLTLTRMEQDDAERVELDPGRVADVIRGATETCQARAGKRSVRLAVLCPEELEAWVNAPLLEQAVVNLLDNAIKYSEPGMEVAISAERRGDRITIGVRDHGPGIAAEHQPRVFERFYRTDKARSRELGGTGLGLSIVKHVALAHGGSVSVESDLGTGSTFRIHLRAT